MRIVGGELKGRALASPEGSATRPTSDRAREAVFNILNHASWLKGWGLGDSTVMDVFAGTGAMGIEALSRGAKNAVFIEREYAAAKTCQQNIDAFGLGSRSTLLKFDALHPVPRPLYIEQRNLVFLDPPYGKDMGAKTLTALAAKGWLAENAICVMEMAKKQQEPAVPGFKQHDERSYGVALVRFLEWEGPEAA
ncbi:MAG: 16S rRNA (guanine(966)-N(2))-methyltransferase RsmD [Micavibrio sp.]|nr:16S rRNA (guanine(966)-N(2))-methyltransferase RsmD [Micavibrio sp.]